MTRTPCKKIYYKVELLLESPLTIGSGRDIATDQDIIKNRNGEPYIPATALTGIYRTLFEEEKAKQYFGYVKIEGEVKEEKNLQKETEMVLQKDRNEFTRKSKNSEIIVYDGSLLGEFYLSQRDGVTLDEWKTAKKGSKFNFEILETNAHFIIFLEITEKVPKGEENGKSELKTVVEQILRFLRSGTIHLGARTTRGYGKVKAEHIWKAEFDFSKTEEVMKRWLDFNLYANTSEWNEITEEITKEITNFSQKSFLRISLKLKQKSGIFIRKYATDKKMEVPEEQKMEKSDLSKEIQVGSEQLTLHDTNRSPVIPGSSWAGAFRHHLKRLMKEGDIYESQLIEQWFGIVNKKKKISKKSLIVFHETVLRGTKEKTITRNAIDRFSGAVVDGALFKEKFCIDGHGNLEILIRKEKESILKQKETIFFQLLSATIMDLHNGILAIGGVTASGRGLFEVESITIGKAEAFMIEGDSSYQKVYQILQEEWKKILVDSEG